MAALRELLGPPAAAVRPVDWDEVRARLGTGLPADYREFIDTYGPGRLGDVAIMAPGAPGNWDLFELLDRKWLQAQGTGFIATVDSPFHPEPGGTISWGETADCWTCCWAPAEADPDAWNVAVLMPTPELRGYRLIAGVSFTSALRRYMAGQPDPLPRASEGRPVTFTPYWQA
jgi:hypothetical protein